MSPFHPQTFASFYLRDPHQLHQMRPFSQASHKRVHLKLKKQKSVKLCVSPKTHSQKNIFHCVTKKKSGMSRRNYADRSRNKSIQKKLLYKYYGVAYNIHIIQNLCHRSQLKFTERQQKGIHSKLYVIEKA